MSATDSNWSTIRGETVDTDMKKFVLDLTEHTDYGGWLALMRFGMQTLLQDQKFLFNLILAENQKSSLEVGIILSDLGLKLVLA
jgi:hypothetical protein